MEELAYAVPRHVSSNDDIETIAAAVEEQIDEHEAKAQQLRDAMQAHLELNRADTQRANLTRTAASAQHWLQPSPETDRGLNVVSKTVGPVSQDEGINARLSGLTLCA